MIEAPEPTPPADRGDSLSAALTGRRSVRAFSNAPVPRSVVERAILAAGWAPSPHNSQPWRFVVIESAARRRALADAMATDWERQLRFDGQDEATVQIRLQKGKERLTQPPVVVVACLYLADLDDYPDAGRQEAEVTMAIQSLGSAVQNLLLSVYASGFDAGWMCAPLFCPDIVRQSLGLDPTLIPHAMIPIGKAARDPVRKPRRPLEELIADWQ
ncbi:MAG: nitroreductase family protein [Thermomicrobiales bacterium]|nr:nitroreductase family protein [Thermomicrobiales bacterium]